MELSGIVLTVLALGSIIGGIFLLKKSAKNFDLTSEQLAKIKKRNETLDKAEKEN